MYLYLIDEYTGDPVVPEEGGSYPIKITQPSENAVKLLPLMRAGLKVMSVVNGAAFVGHMFGVPIPSVPDAWKEMANNAVGSLDKKSSVDEFDVLQETIDSETETKAEGKDKQAVRGAALREFERFLTKEDPENTFCGLNRIVTADGKACWTILNQKEFEDEEAKIGSQVRICRDLFVFLISKSMQGAENGTAVVAANKAEKEAAVVAAFDAAVDAAVAKKEAEKEAEKEAAVAAAVAELGEMRNQVYSIYDVQRL
jgi:hypothetical protein